MSAPLRRLALRGGAALLAVALALLATQQWAAARWTHVGAEARRSGERAPVVAFVLESADRLWPPRREAAFERARLAADVGDAETADQWLERCRGRIPSRVRWLQLAANVAHARGDLRTAERHLSTSLRLDPHAEPSDWEGLATLRERIAAPSALVESARLRRQIFEPRGAESR